MTCTPSQPITVGTTAAITLTVQVTATTSPLINTAIASGTTTQTDQSGDDAAVTRTPRSPHPGTTASTLARTGDSPSTGLHLAGMLEALGIVLVLVSTLGRRRRKVHPD